MRPFSRRALLMFAVAAPAAGFAAGAAAQGACVNLDALSSGQKAMRTSLGFKMVSPDAKRRCGGCAFYTAVEGSCGKCTLLSNGAVPAEGVCDSWAPRK